MEQTTKETLLKHFTSGSNLPKIIIGVVILALASGTLTGRLMTTKVGSGGKVAISLNQPPKAASQDTRTFRDFAEGTIKPKPQPEDPSEYTEGTHLLEREGQVPVALTSSVVDLSKYEGKKVKIYGETQKALKEGWLMDVGRIEEVK